MQNAMTLSALLTEVLRQTTTKLDRITSTKDNIRMVPAVFGEADASPRIVLLREGKEVLERYTITENAHQQIASRLEIPWKYYGRLLADHPDLVMAQVNALFEREPKMRLIRILDGSVRAFLSDRYLRLDNHEVLEHALPLVVKGGFANELLASHVDENKMHIKCVFTDDALKHEITNARGEPRIMRPGFRISNSETGQGKFRIEGFFYDGFCRNGTVFRMKEIFDFERSHMGGRLIEGEGFEVVSDKTKQIMNDLIKSQTHDALAALSNPESVAAMAAALRRAATTEACKHPTAAVDLAVKELPLLEREKEGILETFLRDGDYTMYGLSAAITEQANNPTKCSFKRACELEDIGGQVLEMGLREWDRFVHAETKLAA